MGNDPNDVIQLKEARERMERDLKRRQSTTQRTDSLNPDNDAGMPTHDLPTGTIYKSRLEAESRDERLKEFNKKYAFVNSYGSKPAVAKQVYNELYNREVLEFVSPESILQIHNNEIYDGDPLSNKPLPLGKWWLQNLHRKTFETVTFEPDKAPGEYTNEAGTQLYLNRWEGFAVTPLLVDPKTGKKYTWKRLRKHIYKVLCSCDKQKFKYTMRWLAWCIQNPGRRAEVVMIFTGKKGSGKSLFFSTFKSLFGIHGLAVGTSQHLTGKFNEHLGICVFLLAEEAYNVNKREEEGIMKNLITEESIAIEPKFRGLKMHKNCLHIVMTTNANWVIPATSDEIRFFITETNNCYAMNECPNDVREKYFTELKKEIDNGGKEAMLYALKNLKLGNFHPRFGIPQTVELRRQVALTLPRVKYAFAQILEDGILPGEIIKDKYVVGAKTLLDYIHNLEPHNSTISMKSLKLLCEELGLKPYRTPTSRGFEFLELDAMRELWDAKVTTMEWDDTKKWVVQPTHPSTPF